MERPNPYAPPRSALSEAPDQRPSLLWRIYFGFLILILVITLDMLSVEAAQPLDYLDLSISVVGVTGFFGYAFSRRLGRLAWWRSWFFVQVIWDGLYLLAFPALGVAGLYVDEQPPTAAEIALTLPLILPLYIGLFRYGHRCDPLWSADRAVRRLS